MIDTPEPHSTGVGEVKCMQSHDAECMRTQRHYERTNMSLFQRASIIRAITAH